MAVVGANAGSDARKGREVSRTCIVTRAERPVEELIRFVEGPDGDIVPDLGRRLPGRGVWVTATRENVTLAARRNAFAKSLKKPVKAPADLADKVEQLLIDRLRQALSIANKAGGVVTGFAKVEAALAGGRVLALVHAADAARDGAAKLDRKLMASLSSRAACPPSLLDDGVRPPAKTFRSELSVASRGSDPENASRGSDPVSSPIITELTGPDLDLAIGRSNVVHAALSDGGASRKFVREARRLRHYRTSDESEAVAADTPREGSSTGQA